MKKAILSLVILTFSISLNAQQKFTSVVQFMDSLAIWTKENSLCRGRFYSGEERDRYTATWKYLDIDWRQYR